MNKEIAIKEFTDDKIIIEIEPLLAEEISSAFEKLALSQNTTITRQKKYEELYEFFRNAFLGWMFNKVKKGIEKKKETEK